MEIIGFITALLIGVSLGLIGGGGSILTVPILVYFFKIDPLAATSYSLFIVGITASVGSYKNYKLQHLDFTKALYFAVPAIASILTVRKFILPILPDIFFKVNNFVLTKNKFIMIVFGILMLSSSMAMIFRKTSEVPHKTNLFKLSLIGLTVGIVTGFLGAGGGFLIIPALLFFGGLEMKNAVGTSLFIIAVNSLLGFAGDVINGLTINYKLLLFLSAISITGVFFGTFLLTKVKSQKLKPAFGWFVLTIGIFILFNEIAHPK
ncbi:sulfite exporter TauE/SafE family protein [Flavobacterium sp. H122]|uniref:sulfite exporter TauE/SafE family protein n=1 Tax=Flavobacterium sp. H122 TaxID=2529860 RepID=UPI0010AB1A48|nr:sulfite exporter TauE/SafE family protein [Flavobacterium sp. H122]